jgi:hypothetical protein
VVNTKKIRKWDTTPRFAEITGLSKSDGSGGSFVDIVTQHLKILLGVNELSTLRKTILSKAIDAL